MLHPDPKHQGCWYRANPICPGPCSPLSRYLCPSHGHCRSYSGLDNKGTHGDSLTPYATKLKDKLQVADGSSPRQLDVTPHGKQDQSLESGHLLFWPAQKPSILRLTTLRSSLGEPHLSHSVSAA